MAIQAQLFPDNLGFALSNSQDLAMENACGFDNNLCFLPQQHNQLIQLDQFQNSSQQRLSFLVDNNNVQFHHGQSMTFSQTMEMQRLEFEQLVNLENERLMIAMREQRKQQIAVLIKKYQWKSELLVKQKEEEIAKAANKRTELEKLMKRMEMEKQTWQRLAKENEAAITSLNCWIERLRESAGEDAESCCQGQGDEEEEAKSEKIVCKWCNTRNSCVVMLPCRHLSSCTDCEVFLDSCPVCTEPKKGTIEALF